ncbi:MAG TPA: methyltransferase dimerization domain-containing protein, partial [Schlesneria sp.]
MESTAAVQQPSPAQAAVLQMAMGAMVTKVMAEATRLGIPDLVKEHGPLSAGEMVITWGVDAVPDSLERVLRACASVHIFSEDTGGRFGPTELSETLTASSPSSLKKMIEAMGGPWYKGWTELGAAIRTGQPQARNVFGADWWDYLNA